MKPIITSLQCLLASSLTWWLLCSVWQHGTIYSTVALSDMCKKKEGIVPTKGRGLLHDDPLFGPLPHFCSSQNFMGIRYTVYMIYCVYIYIHTCVHMFPKTHYSKRDKWLLQFLGSSIYLPKIHRAHGRACLSSKMVFVFCAVWQFGVWVCPSCSDDQITHTNRPRPKDFTFYMGTVRRSCLFVFHPVTQTRAKSKHVFFQTKSTPNFETSSDLFSFFPHFPPLFWWRF